jgi:hypothetical protein
LHPNHKSTDRVTASEYGHLGSQSAIVALTSQGAPPQPL